MRRRSYAKYKQSVTTMSIEVFPSPPRRTTNPRKHFDERTAARTRSQFQDAGSLGAAAGATARRNKIRVVIGARRLKAARPAELESVPVHLVSLTDAEAIEAQVVENLQREDIHP